MKRRTDTPYNEWLEDLLDEVFERAEKRDISFAQLAKKAGVSYTTVLRYHYRLTLYPRLKTCLQLCWAVGIDVVLVQHEAKKHKKSA